MELPHALIDAERWIASCPPQDVHRIRSLCLSIRKAELELMRQAHFYLQTCMHHCEGLCCKNVFLDEVMGFEDFCYILLLHPELSETLHAHLNGLKGLFTSDCPFLLNGKGPCILPEAVRPEICITSFCMQTPKADTAIANVKSRFRKLAWTIRGIRIRHTLQKLFTRVALLR